MSQSLPFFNEHIHIYLMVMLQNCFSQLSTTGKHQGGGIFQFLLTNSSTIYLYILQNKHILLYTCSSSSALMFGQSTNVCCHIILKSLQNKQIGCSSHFRCFILQQRLEGCDKLVLLDSFGLVLRWFQLESNQNYSTILQVLQPQIGNFSQYAVQISILLPVTIQCNYITEAKDKCSQGGILFVNRQPF